MHAINIISGISMLGVLIGSAALIIILSVFNGFQDVILSLNSNFTPEIKIDIFIYRGAVRKSTN
jgi:lipoprotein-releasing system permease protein